MNINEHIYELYIRLLTDKALFQWLLDPSKEPNTYLTKIMQEDPVKYEAINQLKIIFKHMNIEDEHLTEETKKELWSRIEASIIKTQKPKHRKLSFFFRYAAAFLLLIAFSVYFFMLREKQAENPIDYEQVISDMMPMVAEDSNNVILVLDNNEKIEIKDNQAQLKYDKGGNIHVNSILIKETERTKEPGKSFNQLYVPYGKITTITMNDGTKIWVNSGSKLIYPPSFANDKREIYVDGEIYLEVIKNKEVPFIVKTGLFDIQVLGTSFNISAYSSDDRQSVVLASGSVSVKDTKENRISIISPNQKYTYEKSNDSFRLQEVNALEYTNWRFGFLSLHKERLENVLKKIERFYNVRIDYAAGQSDYYILSGKLDLKENIEETFRILAITAPIDYSIRDNMIKVVVKP
ncbi:MAG: FecR family protein [Tannerellaceae bacterium]|jgi:hypothetical protein|nr:FecR family protein [Tannerellaceae bacterium]